jgi:hypothetical protein
VIFTFPQTPVAWLRLGYESEWKWEFGKCSLSRNKTGRPNHATHQPNESHHRSDHSPITARHQSLPISTNLPKGISSLWTTIIAESDRVCIHTAFSLRSEKPAVQHSSSTTQFTPPLLSSYAVDTRYQS